MNRDFVGEAHLIDIANRDVLLRVPDHFQVLLFAMPQDAGCMAFFIRLSMKVVGYLPTREPESQKRGVVPKVKVVLVFENANEVDPLSLVIEDDRTACLNELFLTFV